ncbi:lipoyl synthase, partial [Staphylococcus sp. SIMBA_130]
AVARDDLKDGGAAVFAETVRAIRRKNPFCSIEVLPSDMGGQYEALETLMDAKPDIMNHNIETVERLTPRVRARAKYRR